MRFLLENHQIVSEVFSVKSFIVSDILVENLETFRIDGNTEHYTMRR